MPIFPLHISYISLGAGYVPAAFNSKVICLILDLPSTFRCAEIPCLNSRYLRLIPVESDTLPASVCFVGDEGWLAGDRRIDDGKSVKLIGILFHSSDRGEHWNEIKFREMNLSVLTYASLTINMDGW